ncbi:MAG TPA: hypothetical protein PKH69_00690 [Thiobacillaceae bacterium]|nr:hypothetical protein [Thiobacillaceae bacterium]HNU63369.1 hypothetical protein [Thiobacillaceae bacterium]
MSTRLGQGSPVQLERRTHPHLRSLFNEARARIDDFFQDAGNWAGTPIDYLALRVVHETYPDLKPEDVRILVGAIERRYGQEQRFSQQDFQRLNARR